MQKFGLERISSKDLNAVELEIVKEKATALGRAGRKLRQAIEKHAQQSTPATIDAIQNAIWELIIQREFVGIKSGNLEWIKQHYKIPAGVSYAE